MMDSKKTRFWANNKNYLNECYTLRGYNSLEKTAEV